MKIVVGLGNPGSKYEGTRHNAGYFVVDRLAEHVEVAPAGEQARFSDEKKFESLVAKVSKDGEDVLLVKPTTFMNLSGRAVQRIMRFYKANIKDLIIINDDIDLPLGQARIRHEGGSAGQKGLQNIIDSIGTDEFTRIRIGVGEYTGNIQEQEKIYPKSDTIDFVLSGFSDREATLLEKVSGEVIDYIMPFLGSKEEQIPAHTIDVLK